MPGLAIRGEKSFGPTMAVVMRVAATNVTEGAIPERRTLADAGHWLKEGQPVAKVAAMRPFFDGSA